MFTILFQRVIYQCTYRGCGEQHITVRSIEAHVRKEHLLKEDPDKFLEEGEEEFYYTEVSSMPFHEFLKYLQKPFHQQLLPFHDFWSLNEYICCAGGRLFWNVSHGGGGSAGQAPDTGPAVPVRVGAAGHHPVHLHEAQVLLVVVGLVVGRVSAGFPQPGRPLGHGPAGPRGPRQGRRLGGTEVDPGDDHRPDPAPDNQPGRAHYLAPGEKQLCHFNAHHHRAISCK